MTLDDFDKTDCIFFFGQNAGSNAPRMLHPLQEASKRGVPIVTFNPLRERGLERFTNPQIAGRDADRQETRISSQYHQVTAGGDIAAIMGICKAWSRWTTRPARPAGRVLDHAFIAEHTHGFDDFAARLRAQPGTRSSGVRPDRAAMEAAADVYARRKRGDRHLRHGPDPAPCTASRTSQMLVNLLLLRGNIGKRGAGICPVRGHSNVQGQRTVGITEKPELVPLDKLAAQYGFEPPREKGSTRSRPARASWPARSRPSSASAATSSARSRTEAMEAAWRGMRLTVQIATKLNRSHLVHGEVAYLLPCLGRIEVDVQATGRRRCRWRTARLHPRLARACAPRPARTCCREPRIVAEIAQATLPPNPKVAWDAWVGDYRPIRDAIEETYPDQFHDFNERMFQPGGFHRRCRRASAIWKTKTGKANFITPDELDEDATCRRTRPTCCG